MPASEAQIRASKANGCLSNGPKTEEGRARSRRSALKHGLTGAGIVMPEEDAAEVERLSVALRQEFQADGEAERLLTHRMAAMFVRMERCATQETAALSERVRRVMDEFEAPEGVDAETAEQLRIEAGKIALFDPSEPACRARKYEAAAERCFYRSLTELRLLKKDSAKATSQESASEHAAQLKKSMAQLGSFLPAAAKAPATVPTPPPAPSKPVMKPAPVPSTDWDPFATDHFDVPFAIGKRR
jgi:hypothetical protein